MPVTGSSLVLRWAIDHDGVIRLSDEEAVETMRRGTSWLVTGGGILWSVSPGLSYRYDFGTIRGCRAALVHVRGGGPSMQQVALEEWTEDWEGFQASRRWCGSSRRSQFFLINDLLGVYFS